MQSPLTHCKFSEPKGFVHQHSLKHHGLDAFQEKTGLNLDRFVDIQKLLAINLLTQSRNLRDPEGDPDYAVKRMVPLYSCNDLEYTKFIQAFISTELPAFLAGRSSLRAEQHLGSVPARLARAYGQ